MTNNEKDLFHIREYNEAMEFAKVCGLMSDEEVANLAWENLSEDKKQQIRAENERYWNSMHNLGEAIRTGAPLPEIV